jgi:predicted enzyme related to lactoylglutathione lyase
MIRGVHTMFYTSEPEALREFLRDKLGLAATDVGGGWLIFDLPQAEMGCHPAEKEGREVASGTPYLSFYCDDLEATVADLAGRGVDFVDRPADVGYGRAVHFRAPGGFVIELYEPSYGVERAAAGEGPATRPGLISWADLTVPDATAVQDFYRQVAGWESSEVDMGGYADYGMHPPGGGPMVAGVCHARGVNADLPAQWLVYVTVADVDAAAGRCRELGGEVLAGPRSLGGGRMCVIRDPAGAVCALYSPGPA